MSTHKHAQGPWIAKKWTNYGDYNISNDNFGNIAEVTSRGGEFENTTEANARLIAAAPDLMEALDGLSHSVRLFLGEDEPTTKQREALWEMWENARAAIAKATGKEGL